MFDIFIRPVKGGKIIGCLMLVALSACSVAPDGVSPHDPYEKLNRKTHAFNKAVDRSVVRPVAKTYDAVLPDPVEDGISNVASNLSLPGKIVNNILQGDFQGAGQNTVRFVLNSTFGLGGLLDPSSEFDLPEVDTDFGETLHTWGVPEGAYIELPILGPSTERDAVGEVVDIFLDPMGYVLGTPEASYRRGARVGELLQKRHSLGDQIDEVLYESADSYAQSQLIFLQNRRFELEDTTGEDYIDPYIDPYEDFE